MKKSESDSESDKRMHEILKWFKENEIQSLKDRLKALENEVEAMQKGDNTGFRHENDGGWFE